MILIQVPSSCTECLYATGQHLINRHHSLQRYDLVVSTTNAPKARRDGKTSRAGRVRAAGDRGSVTRNVNATTQCYDRPCCKNIRTTTDNRTTLNTPALVRSRRSTDHHLRHQYIIDNGYSSTDTDHTPARMNYNQPPPGSRQINCILSDDIIRFRFTSMDLVITITAIITNVIKFIFNIRNKLNASVMGYEISIRYPRDFKAKCTFSNSCPNLQQQQQGHLVSPRRRQLDVNKRRTTIYKGARRPATADVPKLSTTEHFHDTQPLILFVTLSEHVAHPSSLITPEEKTIPFNVAESIRQDDNINKHCIIEVANPSNKTSLETLDLSLEIINKTHKLIDLGSPSKSSITTESPKERPSLFRSSSERQSMKIKHSLARSLSLDNKKVTHSKVTDNFEHTSRENRV
ncbi:hypothetical protein AGLY_017450 [Aphis glycines]|uniref:Uncharacterized protein n=1 Tax=Aphis glycines TaxID=307491 RepID=A0A6G0SUX4_APHGL|nr:hypothetical protein AGLY_017450 [Aphis glycines]